jgi:hypothetical protein
MQGTFMIRRGTNECGIEVMMPKRCSSAAVFLRQPKSGWFCRIVTRGVQLGALDRGCPLAGVPEVSV